MTVVRSAKPLQKNSFYPTPFWATVALLRHINIDGLTVWEPAAGDHRMADVLGCHAARVLTSDIAHYGRDHNLIFDFLQDDTVAPWSVDALITNPPYGARNELAVPFARLALRRCAGTVALLLTANFDGAKSRVDLFHGNSRFQKKLVLVDRCRWFTGKGTLDGTSDHAWFIWGPDKYLNKQVVYDGRQPL